MSEVASRKQIDAGSVEHRYAEGGPAADEAAYRSNFSGKYTHRIISGIGRNVSEEDPQAIALAIVDAGRFA